MASFAAKIETLKICFPLLSKFDAETFSKTTPSITTFSIKTPCITAFSITIPCITTFSIMAFDKMTLSVTIKNEILNIMILNDMPSVVILSITTLSMTMKAKGNEHKRH
jgi:hypothetical protein